MVGNCPHSSLTQRTSVTRIKNKKISNCIDATKKLRQIVFLMTLYFLCGQLFSSSNLVNFSTNVGNFLSVWQQGG